MRLSIIFTYIVFSCFATSGAFADPWKRHTIDNTSRGADGVRLADMNGDGLMDVATGWEEGGVTRVYTHPGIAKVKQPWPLVTVGKTPNVEDAVWFDADNDGRMDVVSSCEGKTRKLFIHWNNKDGWKQEVLPAPNQQWMFALPLDVDGKNGVDLVVGSKGGDASVGWLESPADSRNVAAWKYHRWTDAGWIMSLRAIDMDGDSDLDVLYSDRRGKTSGIRWLGNQTDDGELEWATHDVAARGKEILFLDAKSGPTENKRTIAATIKTAGILVHRQITSTITTERIDWPTESGREKAVAIGDINLDGKSDLVISSESSQDQTGVQWLSKVGDGDWESLDISGKPGTKFDRIELIDLDKDGDLDVMTCEERENLGVIWYENPTR